MPRTPEERELALECLKLAQAQAVVTNERPEDLAAKFYAFVTGGGAEEPAGP